MEYYTNVPDNRGNVTSARKRQGGACPTSPLGDPSAPVGWPVGSMAWAFLGFAAGVEVLVLACCGLYCCCGCCVQGAGLWARCPIEAIGVGVECGGLRRARRMLKAHPPHGRVRAMPQQ